MLVLLSSPAFLALYDPVVLYSGIMRTACYYKNIKLLVFEQASIISDIMGPYLFLRCIMTISIIQMIIITKTTAATTPYIRLLLLPLTIFSERWEI